MKIATFDVSYLRNPLTQELKFFFVESCPSQVVPKIFSSFYDFGNMANERPQNGENGHFITFVYYYSWQVGFSEISYTSTMLLVLCSSVVQHVPTWPQMSLPCIDSLQDQLVTVRVVMEACQPPDIDAKKPINYNVFIYHHYIVVFKLLIHTTL